MAITKMVSKIGVLYPLLEAYKGIRYSFIVLHRPYIELAHGRMRFTPVARGLTAQLLEDKGYDAWR